MTPTLKMRNRKLRQQTRPGRANGGCAAAQDAVVAIPKKVVDSYYALSRSTEIQQCED